MRSLRFGYILALFICLFLSSCMTYQKALRKFGHLEKDSLTVTVSDTVHIPRDSLVTRFKTDTVDFERIIDTPRMKLSINRTRLQTSVKAECKPDTIIRRINVDCPPVASFGVNAHYKTGFWILAGLLLVAAIVYVFLYHLQLSISKR